MSELSVHTGSIFWAKESGATKRHLRVVATNPDALQVVIVPINTWYSQYPKDCLLETSDISELDRTSLPAYAFVCVWTPAQLHTLLAHRESRVIPPPRGVVKKAVLNRVLSAVLRHWQELQPGVYPQMHAMSRSGYQSH